MTRRFRVLLRSFLLLACLGAPAGAGAAESLRVGDPETHANLSVYFIHGPSAPGPVPLTLAEALARHSVVVTETGEVNELTIENTGAEEVFIQAGSIVKGGRQDRVLTVSLLLPAHSGTVPIAAFCVEHGRWSGRSGEDGASFASAEALIPSHDAKRVLREAESKTPAPGGRAAAVWNGQEKIWNDVGAIQQQLSRKLGTDVAAPQSRTSLQLALENGALRQAEAEYQQALAPAGEAEPDIVGVAFAIDGKLDSAELYPSNALFRKMWRPLLAAGITEALSRRETTTAAPPESAAVRALLEPAAPASVSDPAAGMRLLTRETDAGTSFETVRPGEAGFVERSYLAR